MYKYLGATLGQGKGDTKVDKLVDSHEARWPLDYPNAGLGQIGGWGRKKECNKQSVLRWQGMDSVYHSGACETSDLPLLDIVWIVQRNSSNPW